jgi:hypothetical protein
VIEAQRTTLIQIIKVPHLQKPNNRVLKISTQITVLGIIHFVPQLGKEHSVKSNLGSIILQENRYDLRLMNLNLGSGEDLRKG